MLYLHRFSEPSRVAHAT